VLVAIVLVPCWLLLVLDRNMFFVSLQKKMDCYWNQFRKLKSFGILREKVDYITYKPAELFYPAECCFNNFKNYNKYLQLKFLRAMMTFVSTLFLKCST